MSEKLNTEIEIGGVDIAFFLDIVLEDIYIKDLHNNTLLYAEKLQLDVNKFSNSNHIITLGNIILKKSIIGLRRYKGEEKMNFRFITDYFSSKDTTTTEPVNWTINCEGLEIVDSRLIYQDQKKMAIEKNRKGIDFNNLDLTSLNIKMEDLDTNEDTISAYIQNISCIEQSGFILNEFATLVKFSPKEIETIDLKIKTPITTVFMDLTLTYDSLNHFNDFVNKVTMNVVIDTSILFINDIGYFAPDLLGMNNIISLAGEIKGKVNNLNIKKFGFNYGKSRKFFGNI